MRNNFWMQEFEELRDADVAFHFDSIVLLNIDPFKELPQDRPLFLYAAPRIQIIQDMISLGSFPHLPVPIPVPVPGLTDPGRKSLYPGI